jgi:hypothetical protein
VALFSIAVSSKKYSFFAVKNASVFGIFEIAPPTCGDPSADLE